MTLGWIARMIGCGMAGAILVEGSVREVLLAIGFAWMTNDEE